MKLWQKFAATLAAAALLIGIGLVAAADLLRDQFTDRIFNRIDDLPERTWAIVLGAKVWGHEPSPMLEDRLITAAELYRKGKVRKLFLTGGPSENGVHEVTMMTDWLVAHAVPREALMQDPNGLRTLDSLVNARQQFDTIDPIIVTQRFHLSRTLYIAKTVAFDAIGMVADRRAYHDEYFHRLREIAAQAKAVFDHFEPVVTEGIRGYLLPADYKRAQIEAGRERIRRLFAEHGLVYPPTKVKLAYFKSKQKLELYVAGGGYSTA